MDSSTPDTRFLQSTSFIGRTSELVELKRMLEDPSCRLITLQGPGGTGKTRLSTEVARIHERDFPDGARFIPLQPVTSVEFLIPAIAEELSVTIRSQEDPARALFAFLAEKEMLLVLDNFEQIVEAAEFISAMLAAAPRIKIIVSSREALNISDEWVFPLSGLSFPTDLNAEPEWFDSVRLFVERARRVKRDFAPDAHWESIARICTLVQGSPLAVELAATWIRSLMPEEIVNEISRNLDFLSTSVRNVPERHRSVRAVFEESWRLLDDDAERDVLARLSVFRGTFDRKAAEVVAGASLPLLTGLIEKSLVRSLQDGRYQLHMLVNQYAGEKLAEYPAKVEEVRATHARYYLGFLRDEIGLRIYGADQMNVSALIAPEIDNIRAAWSHAVEIGDSDMISPVSHILSEYFQFKNLWFEGVAIMTQTVELLEKREQTPDVEFAIANALIQLSWFQMRLGAIDESEANALRCDEIMKRLGVPPVPGFASDHRINLGIIGTIRGNYAEAARWGEAARATAEPRDDWGNLALSFYVLTRVGILQGDLDAAYRRVDQALTANDQTGDPWFRGYLLVERGNIERLRGNTTAARPNYREVYEIREKFGDTEGMAVALTFLGDLALIEGNNEEATNCYGRALDLYLKIQDKGGLAQALEGSARAAAAQGEPDHAREHVREGIAYAAEISHVPQVIALLGILGAIELAEGDEEQAFPLLCVALYHPSSNHETRERVLALGDAIKSMEICDVKTAVKTLTDTLGLDTDLGIEELLENARREGLEIVGEEDEPHVLPDGLTEREGEVLRLLAAGKSNQQIADELFITTNTVANHVKNILSKTQTSNRTEAAAYAVQHGLS
jgi:predicted ATPase/DNA-binding CsgD family transcriptional regulator